MDREPPFLVHHGAGGSFDVFLHRGRKEITVVFHGGRKVTFKAARGSDRVEFIFPSVGGEVLVCCLRSGKRVVFGSGNGQKVAADSEMARTARFYD